ncbi:MAG: MFS transporter [Alphaproteobacteria bacterium]|nr:MFS transporter [Alphaproteobacteria bacterium]|tara:strand:+ start:59 stop:1339 length:1281 start_codon:yes stop_codon:yes gene_type:complete
MNQNPSTHRSGVVAIAVLVLVFALFMLARGMIETWPVFLTPVQSGLAWSRAEVASVYSVLMMTFGLGGIITGLAHDRFGPRAIYTVGLLLLGGGYFAASRLDSVWQFYVAIGICGGLGAAAIGMVPAQALISRWFDRNLAAAMAFASTGLGFGTLCLAPLSQVLIDAFDWRGALEIIGGTIVVLAVAVILLPWQRISAGPVRPSGSSDGPSLLEAAKTRAFWALWGAFFATSVGMYAVSLQSVTYMIENGMDPLDAATAFGVAGGLSIVGMLVTGIAADRWDRRVIAVLSYGLSMIGLLALFLMPQLPVAAAILVFVTCFGLSLGVRSPIIATLSAQLFRGRGMASIYGSIQTGQGVGAAVGTWIAGVLFDATGSYGAIFILSFTALFVAIALFWLVQEMRVAGARNQKNQAANWGSDRGSDPNTG